MIRKHTSIVSHGRNATLHSTFHIAMCNKTFHDCVLILIKHTSRNALGGTQMSSMVELFGKAKKHMVKGSTNCCSSEDIVECGSIWNWQRAEKGDLNGLYCEVTYGTKTAKRKSI